MPRVDVVTTLSAFEALRDPWNALADATGPSPLLRHEWLLAAARSFAGDGDLMIFVVREGERLRAAAPMVIARNGVVARLRLLGWETSEPEAFLHADAAALEAVCAAVLSAGRPVLLQRLYTDSAEWRVLERQARPRGVAVLRPSTSPYYLTVLGDDWARFEAAMPSKKRSELRGRRRALEAEGPVVFEMRKPHDAAEAAELLARLQEIESAGWKGRNGSDMLSRPALARFMGEYAAAAAAAGMLRISSLTVGDTTVSMQMDVEHGGRLWGLKMGNHPDWLKFSPGVVSTHEIYRWSIENGLEGCEHLGRAEDWQKRWPYEVRDCSTFRFYPRRLGAAVAFGIDAAAYARRNAKARAGQPDKARAA